MFPLLCSPVFYGHFYHLVGGEVPLLMSALVIKLVAHDGDGERLEVIFCLDILVHVPQPEHAVKIQLMVVYAASVIVNAFPGFLLQGCKFIILRSKQFRQGHLL